MSPSEDPAVLIVFAAWAAFLLWAVLLVAHLVWLGQP